MLHLSEWSRTLALMSTDTRGFWFTWWYVSQDVRKLWPQDDLSLTQSICPMNAATLHLSDRSKTLVFMRTDAHFYGSHTDTDSVCFAADMQHMTITTPLLWHSQYVLWMSSRCTCQIDLKRLNSWEQMLIFMVLTQTLIRYVLQHTCNIWVSQRPRSDTTNMPHKCHHIALVRLVSNASISENRRTFLCFVQVTC